MRFEKDIVELSLAKIKEEIQLYETLKEGIIELISELPLSVPFVKKEEELIRRAQSGSYWTTITENDFDELIDKLAPLMKFREGTGGGDPVLLNLKDEIFKKEMVEFGPQHEAVSISRYREMVEELITKLTDENPVLQKIRDGVQVSSSEAEELAELLHEEYPHITDALLQKVYRNRKAHLMQFIRHILGIEPLKSFPDTVQEAFDLFIQQHTTLNSRQLEFLNLLKNYIIEREKVEKRDLINAPFTIIHPQGIRGVFSPAEINEIVHLTERLAA